MIDRRNFSKVLFWVIFSLMAFLLILLSAGAGINADEYFQIPQTEYILDFYTSFGSDTRIIDEAPGPFPWYYGKFFEILSALAGKLTGFDAPDEAGFHMVRHILVALFGSLILLFGGLTAKEFRGYSAGIIALFVLFFSPRLTGHSLFNVKDIPFAAGYIMAFYFFYKLLNGLPRLEKKALFGILAGVGMAIGIRIGGLLIIFLLGFFLVLFLILVKRGKSPLGDREIPSEKLFWWLMGTFAGGYFLGILFWPYGLQNPVLHPYEAFKGFANFKYGLKILFEGKLYRSDLAPDHYILKYLLISTPLFFLIGLIIYFIFMGLRFNVKNLFFTGSLFFAGLLPVLFVYFSKSNVYDGWRHLLFAYVPLAITASLGWHFLFSSGKRIAIPSGILFLGLMISPATFMVREKTLSYTYFNEIVGGFKGAYGNYENDYYFLASGKAVKWLNENVLDTVDKPVIIGTNASYPVQTMFKTTGKDIKVKYMNYYQRSKEDWDYGIFQVRYLEPSSYKSGFWPPGNTIYSITVSDRPVVNILQRKSKKDYLAFLQLEEGNMDSATVLLKDHLEVNKQDEQAWFFLGINYFKREQLSEAWSANENSLKIRPESPLAIQTRGILYLHEEEYEKALAEFQKILFEHDDMRVSHFYSGIAYFQLGNFQMAKSHLLKVGSQGDSYSQNAEIVLEEIKKKQ